MAMIPVMTGSITDSQYHWLLNNSMELGYDGICALSKEQAFDIINRAKSQGFEKRTFNPGTIAFWQGVKQQISNSNRSQDSSARGNNYGLPTSGRSQSVAPSKGKI